MLQFIVLIELVFYVAFLPSVYALFVVIGLAALGVLYIERKTHYQEQIPI